MRQLHFGVYFQCGIYTDDIDDDDGDNKVGSNGISTVN